MKKNYHVVPHTDDRWEIRASDHDQTGTIFATRALAFRAVRELAKAPSAKSRETAGTKKSAVTSKSSGGLARKDLGSSSKIQSLPSTGMAHVAQRIGDRLRRARLMEGLSLRGLTEKINAEVSHTMLQKFETGDACPDSRMLARLAQVLNVRPDYFFKTDQLKLVTVEYRSQTKLSIKSRQRLEEQAYEFFERYLEIERILGLPLHEMPVSDISDRKDEELSEAIEAAADNLREKWQLGTQPIPNVHTTMEKQGVKVRILPPEEGFDGFSAFAEYGDFRLPVMALSAHWLRGSEKDLPRFRFTALHELAHLHLILPEHLSHKEKEACCHRFAGAFLIPQKAFQEAFGINRVKIVLDELRSIKSEWGISVAAIMKRASNLGLLTPGRYKTFCIVAAKNGWRTNDPGSWIGSEECNRFKPLVLRALAQDLITVSKAAGLLAISLPELGELYKPIE